MKKIIPILIISLFLLNSCSQDEDLIILSTQNEKNIERENRKIDICHYDEDTGEYHTINVSVNALKAHLAHGDIIGDCNDNLICHWEDPVANIWKPLLVKDEDLQEHLDHGDFLGSCGPNPGEDFTYIPDENFELALIDLGFDSEGVLNKRILTSDISKLPGLNVANKSISDLTGIQDFKNLRILNFSNNQVSTIDISENTLLTLLRFNSNQIVNIDVSNNTLLREFYAYDNELVSLDLSNNPNLYNIYCWNNNLESLNIKNGNNVSINRCWSYANPGLAFITVDDPTSANLGFTPYTTDKWRKGTNSTYN